MKRNIIISILIIVIIGIASFVGYNMGYDRGYSRADSDYYVVFKDGKTVLANKSSNSLRSMGISGRDNDIVTIISFDYYDGTEYVTIELENPTDFTVGGEIYFCTRDVD